MGLRLVSVNKQKQTEKKGIMKVKLMSMLVLVLVGVLTLVGQEIPSTRGGGGTGSTSTEADGFPASLPFLTSVAALRAYAAEQARTADIQIESKGLASGGSHFFGSSWDEPTNQAGIGSHFSRWQYQLEMVNPKDAVTFRGWIRSSEWENLFVSWDTSVQPEIDAEGNYKVPQPYLYFRLADEIPVRIGRDANWARVSQVDENGQTVGEEYLRVQDGKVYFRPGFAGKGILIVTDNEGRNYAYDLRQGGLRIDTEQVLFNGAYAFLDGMYSYYDPQRIVIRVWSWNGVGQNPTLEVNMSTPTDAVSVVEVSISTKEEARANGYMVRMMGEKEWLFYPASDGSALLPFMSGTTYVVPVWNPEEFREPDPVPQPDYGVGKG